MEKKLSQLFDFQRFEQNAELEAVILSVVNKTQARRLSLDEAGMVAAAGEKYLPDEKQDK